MTTQVLVLACSFLAGVGDFQVGGGRPVLVQVPDCYDPETPIPVFVNLHGFTGNGQGQESYWAMRPLSEERCFVYLYPDGTLNGNGARFWNATDACCAGGLTVDDSSYLRGLLDEIADVVNVDWDRIHFMGLSNGGFMSHRLACDHSDVVAAIASQAGAVWSDPVRCGASEPVSVLQIHGTADATISFNGGALGGGSYPSAPQSVLQWAQSNGCSSTLVPVDGLLDIDAATAGAETSVRRHEGCPTGAAAELWTIVGGSHVPSLTRNGSATNLATLVTDWLLAHPKRPAPEASFLISPGEHSLERVFDGSSSIAPEGTTIARYTWDLGDGTTSEGMTVTHEYAAPGRYVASLRVVTDDERVSAPSLEEATVACASGDGDVSPWSSGEIGAPVFPGAASLDGEELQLCAGGDDLVGSGENGHFVHQELTGDFRLTANVSELVGQSSAAAGLMFRESLDAAALYGAIFLERRSSDSLFRFRYRDTAGGNSRNQRGDSLEEPAGWLRLERSDGVVRGFSSLDGEVWILVGEAEVDFPETILGGIAGFGRDLGRTPYTPLQATLSDIKADPLSTTEITFLRGDCDGNGAVEGSVNDAIANFNLCFSGTSVPCLAACDVDNDGEACSGVTDGLRILLFVFLGGEAPPGPFPGCGASGLPSDIALGCGASGCP